MTDLGTLKKIGRGVPKKVEEIADAIREDNPSYSDAKAYRIAWDTYQEDVKGKKSSVHLSEIKKIAETGTQTGVVDRLTRKQQEVQQLAGSPPDRPTDNFGGLNTAKMPKVKQLFTNPTLKGKKMKSMSGTSKLVPKTTPQSKK